MHCKLFHFFVCCKLNKSVNGDVGVCACICTHIYIHTLVCPSIDEIAFALVLTSVRFCPVTLGAINCQSALTRLHGECSFQSKTLN